MNDAYSAGLELAEAMLADMSHDRLSGGHLA